MNSAAAGEEARLSPGICAWTGPERGANGGVEPVLMSISVGSGMPKPPVYISIRATAIRRSPAGSVRPQGKTHAFDPDSDDSRQQELARHIVRFAKSRPG